MNPQSIRIENKTMGLGVLDVVLLGIAVWWGFVAPYSDVGLQRWGPFIGALVCICLFWIVYGQLSKGEKVLDVAIVLMVVAILSAIPFIIRQTAGDFWTMPTIVAELLLLVISFLVYYARRSGSGWFYAKS